jgi:6-phosphogluconolactonase (cycloisomerase 2 family)
MDGWKGPSFECEVNKLRRRLLLGSASLGAVPIVSLTAPIAFATGTVRSYDAKSKGRPMFAYVGCRTTRERNARGDGISVFRCNAQTSALELVQVLKDLVNPSFLALSSNGERLYTVHGDMSKVSAFAVERTTGMLTFIGEQSTRGNNPVHLAIDFSGRYMVVSNHSSSSLAVLPIKTDGSLEEVTQLTVLDGPIGPHRVEQNLSKPHQALFDQSGEFIVAADKGLDRIFSFRFKDGQLSAANPTFVIARECAGPRHVAFHRNSKFAYCVNELDSTVTTYRYSPRDGSLTALQIVSTLPDTFTANSRASEIQLDRSGRFAYASNRGHNSIAMFRIDGTSGHLTFMDTVQTLGKTPRFIATSPDGQFMYALNEDSDSIVAFNVDHASGRLASTGFSVQSGSPVCMVFSRPLD